MKLLLVSAELENVFSHKIKLDFASSYLQLIHIWRKLSSNNCNDIHVFMNMLVLLSEHIL